MDASKQSSAIDRLQFSYDGDHGFVSDLRAHLLMRLPPSSEQSFSTRNATIAQIVQLKWSWVILKPTDLLGTEVPHAEVRFCASPFDNQDGRAGAVMYLHFNLSG
jgi:hypothetical protein